LGFGSRGRGAILSRVLSYLRLKPGERDSEDVALIHGKTPDGEGLRILRKRADRLEIGAVHPLKEGTPITGEVVTLTPRPEFPLLCDVKTELAAQHVQKTSADVAATPRHGPAQVATDQYRENWDRIWSRPKKAELAN
jgi:hypothetical protein